MMFDRAVSFVRSNIPEVLVEKAAPYYSQAQGYVEQAQSMGHKIADYAATKGSTLKEKSTTYVNGAAERLDSVVIDNGNKLSSKILGREVIHFHFKEALTQLANAKKEKKEETASSTSNKEQQQQQQKQDETSNQPSKEQAASSIANLFNTISSTSSVAIATVTDKLFAARATAQEKVKENKSKIASKIAQSRHVAAKSVAGACSLALKGREFVASKHALVDAYVPATVASLAGSSLASLHDIAGPYFQMALVQSKQLDSKYLSGMTFGFVDEVSAELFPADSQEEETKNSTGATASAPQQDNNSNKTSAAVVNSAAAASPVKHEQEQEVETDVADEQEDSEDNEAPSAEAE